MRHRSLHVRSASLRVPDRSDARNGPDGAGSAAGARHREPVPRAARPARRSALLESGTRARLRLSNVRDLRIGERLVRVRVRVLFREGFEAVLLRRALARTRSQAGGRELGARAVRQTCTTSAHHLYDMLCAMSSRSLYPATLTNEILVTCSAKDCWFCLGSEKVERHLVVFVGDYVRALSFCRFRLFNTVCLLVHVSYAILMSILRCISRFPKAASILFM